MHDIAQAIAFQQRPRLQPKQNLLQVPVGVALYVECNSSLGLIAGLLLVVSGIVVTNMPTAAAAK